MADLSLDDIANRIIDAILNEPHFSKESLFNTIRPILKLWLKQTDKPKILRAKETKLIFTIENREVQSQYWKNKCKELDPNNIEKYYKELDNILIKEGYKT